MNRQWMYGDKHTSEYIKGMHEFLDAAEANKQNGFMCCPCPIYENMKSYSNQKTLHTHLLYKVSCHTIMFGPSTEKEGL